MEHLLIVDDEPAQRSVLAGYLRKKKYAVTEASSATDALRHLALHPVDIVLTDLNMPGASGHDLLRDVRARSPETAVVIMTAFGTIDSAVSAMREGAFDYLTKPIDLRELDLLIRRITERQELISENRLLREQLVEKYSFDGIIAESGEMQSVLHTARRVAQSRASVLIRGESGTGKEVIARTIHYSSPRRDQPFIPVSCAALNEHILESELFGHERGAFTGADRQRRGRFELANGGTMFLDEIGDVPLSVQVKLLRVLQEHQFERVGGTGAISVDVRVLAATNRNLEEMIAGGQFREDLMYRLNVVTIDIPPLRKRRADIAPALDFFLARFAGEQGRKKASFSKEAWEMLVRYDYPGNMRELENLVQRAVILSSRDVITTSDLPPALRNREQEQGARSRPGTSLPEQVERLEKELVLDALGASRGNQSRAAASLGISERNLRYRLKKWNIAFAGQGDTTPD